MKKVLALMLTICMIMAFLPQVSFAAEATIVANTTAFFTPSGSLSLTEGSSESGGSCVLVAWNHSDNWNAAQSFTDTDGTVTNQTVTGGTAFGTSRQAIVSFDIPADFDQDSVAKITLGLTVRYVKQISDAGARLAIYGNSVDGKWTTATPISTFGASGADSGTGSLPLLGLTSPISMAGNNQIDQTVTLSSVKLTDYVKEMVAEGKSQVSFRIAVPYGGVWIYNSTSSYPATLKIEEGTLASVNVKTVYMDGEEVVDEKWDIVPNMIVGDEYTYTEAPANTKVIGGDIYVYSKEDSTLSVTVKADGSSEVVLVYNKYDDSQTFSGYEVEDEGAWCWFADPRSISYANDEGTLDFTIMGYIDIHGNIKATQIDHLTDEVNEVLIRTNIQPDDHNNPTFLVLPDERIIVFYSRHTDEPCFWYRVTKEKGDLTTLGEEKCLNTSANTTYPSPFLLSDDPDHIYLAWRGIEWHPTMAQLSLPDEDGNIRFTWGPYQVIRSTAQGSGCRPYAKYASNGKDTIHIAYTATHPDNVNPNSNYYTAVKFTDFTEGAVKVALQGADGSTLTTSLPFTVNNNETNKAFVVDPRSTSQRGWVWQTAVGNDGKPVIAMVRISGDKTSHDYYYAKWNGTEWVKTFLSNGGGHFHQTAGLEMCYSGGMAIDPDNANIIYCSVPVEGAFGRVYEIIKYTMNDDGTLASSEQITKNSLKNNVRPFVIPNSEGKDIRLIWMYGEYTDWIVSNAHPTAYGTAVHAQAPIPKKIPVIYDWIESENYNDIGGAFVATKETANVLEAEVEGEFTVATKIYLEGDYEGTLFDIGDVEVRVETMNTHYGANTWGDRARVVVAVDGTDYVSSNVYGTSDCWTTYGRGTGGNYGIENYNGYVDHVLTYDGSYLTLYRDGLVDMKIPATEVTLDNVQVGGFDGQVKLTAVYDKVLNRDEIKMFASMDYPVEVPEVEVIRTITKKYVDDKGNELLEEETVDIMTGSEVYNFKPVETIRDEDYVYALDHTEENGDEYTAVYKKANSFSENLIYNGDLSETTKEGSYTYVTGWQGGYVNSVHNPLSDRPYLSEGGGWRSTANMHFIYNAATEGEMASITTPLVSTMENSEQYPFKSDVSENYMAAVLTSWMRDKNNVNEYLKAEKGKSYVMSFEMKATEINPNAWVNNVVGFDAVTDSGDAYTNKIPGTNGDITTLTSVLDTHIGRAKYLDTANEWVKVEALATANEDGYFVFQLGWAFEWGQVSVRNFMVREVVDAKIVDATLSADGTKLTVSFENIDEGCTAFVSINDAENVMSKVYAGVALEFDVMADANKIEVFVWKNATSLEPIVRKTIVK